MAHYALVKNILSKIQRICKYRIVRVIRVRKFWYVVQIDSYRFQTCHLSFKNTKYYFIFHSIFILIKTFKVDIIVPLVNYVS